VALVVETKSLGEQVQEVLLARILSGDYRPGERLSPDQLKTEFGISITPVRDALHRLRQSGFVEVRPRTGVYVANLDAQRASDVFDVRIALEVLAARNAAERISLEELERLRQRYQEADAILAASEDEGVLEEIDTLLHELLAEYSGNELLRNTLKTISYQGAWVRTIAGKGARRYRRSFEEHKGILEALFRKDSAGAAKAMEAHLRNTKATVVRHLKTSELPKRSEAAGRESSPQRKEVSATCAS